MNTYITLACLLAVAGLSHGSAIGLGGLGSGLYGLGGLGGLGYGHGASIISAPILAPAAISHANMVKAAPIPIIRTVSVPIISTPIVKTVAPVGVGSWGGLGGWGGYGGYGLGGLGGWGGYGYGLGGWGGLGWGKH